MNKQLSLLILLTIFIGTVPRSQAITLDDFSKEQFIRTAGNSDFQTLRETYLAGHRPSILGRARKIKTEVLSGAKHSESSLVINNGSIKHSQDAGVSAVSTIIWDGAVDSTEINYLGLNKLNLLQDKPKDFIISVAHFDSPADAPITLELQIYSNKNSYSFARRTINSAISDETEIRIPLYNLQQGGTAPADLSKVGAIALIIYGLDPSIDLEITSLSTDACSLVPDENLQVVDICGVCNGDGRSCLDCLGQINGTAKKDRCGVCNGNGQSCLNCNSTSQSDLLARLDNSIKIQNDLINQIGARLIKLSDTTEIKQFVRRHRNEAAKIQLAGWQAIWTIPQVINNCTNTVFCSQQDYAGSLQIFISNSQKLKSISSKLLNKALEFGISQKYYNSQIQKTAQLHQLNIAEAAKLITKHSVCD